MRSCFFGYQLRIQHIKVLVGDVNESEVGLHWRGVNVLSVW
jgi:hypothetical protein